MSRRTSSAPCSALSTLACAVLASLQAQASLRTGPTPASPSTYRPITTTTPERAITPADRPDGHVCEGVDQRL